MNSVLTLIVFLLSPMVFAGAGHDHVVKVSPEFESLKALAGTWEGTTDMSGKKETTRVVYEVTSNGTALVEKMMPGTPHEMVTVYANQGKKVHMTHYCALGNQPQMKLKKSTNSSFEFEMDGIKGISDKKEMHMHAVTLTLNGDSLKQEWTNFKDGKKADVAVFEFKRKN